MTARQRVVLAALAAYDAPSITARELAAQLLIHEGRLNVTLRSLQRRGLITVTPATPRSDSGWRLRSGSG